MAMTIEEVRSQLSMIESDEQMYANLGQEEVPLLREFLDDDEAWMAARAVYALARIDTPDALAAIEVASGSLREEVRIAVAVSASRLPPPATNRVLEKLLTDDEVGVRKFAIKSVSPANSQRVRDLVGSIAHSDDVLNEIAQSQADQAGD